MERGERGGTVPARMYSSSLPVNCGAAPRQVVAAVVVVLVDLAVALTLRLPPLTPQCAPLYLSLLLCFCRPPFNTTFMGHRFKLATVVRLVSEVNGGSRLTSS